MKKTTSICLFTGMIFLLLVMVVYLLFTQQDTGEKEQDLAVATEEMPAETDTEKEVKTTESLAVYEPYAYIIKQRMGFWSYTRVMVLQNSLKQISASVI